MHTVSVNVVGHLFTCAVLKEVDGAGWWVGLTIGFFDGFDQCGIVMEKLPRGSRITQKQAAK